VRIGLNDLKMVISVTKNSERSAAMKENKLWKDGEKVVENDNINIWINLYYIDLFIVKKLQKIGKNF